MVVTCNPSPQESEAVGSSRPAWAISQDPISKTKEHILNRRTQQLHFQSRSVGCVEPWRWLRKRGPWMIWILQCSQFPQATAKVKQDSNSVVPQALTREDLHPGDTWDQIYVHTIRDVAHLDFKSHLKECWILSFSSTWGMTLNFSSLLHIK
jgi:hypothetical protein